MADDKKAAPATPARTEDPAVGESPRTIIERWFQDTVHNTALSRHTEFFNQMRQAVNDLIARFEPMRALPPTAETRSKAP